MSENLKAAVKFSSERYSIPLKAVAELAAWVLIKVHERQPGMYRRIAAEVIYDERNGPLSGALLSTGQLRGRMALEPTHYVFGRLCEKMRSQGLIEHHEQH